MEVVQPNMVKVSCLESDACIYSTKYSDAGFSYYIPPQVKRIIVRSYKPFYRWE